MTFSRRIFHHGTSPTGTPVVLSSQAVKRCWFELHRQGGCGTGELILANEFQNRDQIELGDWISFEFAPDDRWYLGRVEERHSESPAQTRLRLEGMSIELNEVFPGGFGVAADGKKPHRYAQTELFTHDPDRDQETFDSISTATELVEKLLHQYVLPASHITFNPLLIETPLQVAEISSLKFRGEETVRSVIKELAVRAQSASWGVNELGEFFFLRPAVSSIAEFREGLDLTSLTEIRDREHLFNRILLTGDYIYDRRETSQMIARRSYRWRGNFVEPISRAQHGERRIRIWLPWMRTQSDSLAFAKEFFRTYSQPISRYFFETTTKSFLPKPWQGRYALYDRDGTLLSFSHAETVRVIFDQTTRLRMELGPLDPRELWAEPLQDERWELPDEILSAGGEVSLPPTISISDPPPPPPPPNQPPLPSWWIDSSENNSSLYSSDLTSSLVSSEISSSFSSNGASEVTPLSSIGSTSLSGNEPSGDVSSLHESGNSQAIDSSAIQSSDMNPLSESLGGSSAAEGSASQPDISSLPGNESLSQSDISLSSDMWLESFSLAEGSLLSTVGSGNVSAVSWSSEIFSEIWSESPGMESLSEFLTISDLTVTESMSEEPSSFSVDAPSSEISPSV